MFYRFSGLWALVFVSTSHAFAVPPAETTAVCSYLSANYPSKMIWDPLSPQALKGGPSNSTQYQQFSSDYWNVHSQDNRAACMYFPENAQDVSAVVKQLLKSPSVGFALKSGGHNPNFGFSSTNGGVLISFRPNLQQVVYTSGSSSVQVGPGAIWQEVSDVVIGSGRAVVGGRLGHIGVAGLTLGGGLSYLSSQYGLVCDNVISFEVVKADGCVDSANATQDPNLFWALRGSGNQFAIVTKLTLATYPIGDNGMIWGGVRTYSAEQHPALFSAIANFTSQYPDLKAAIIPNFLMLLTGNLVNLAVVLFFHDGPNPPESVFAEFNKIPATSDQTGKMSYTTLLQEENGGYYQDLRFQIRENTFPALDPSIMLTFLNEQWSIINNAAFGHSITNLIDVNFISHAIQPLSHVIAVASEKINPAGNALGLKPEQGDRIWMEYDLA